MAATGSGDGHQRLATNQDPSVQVSCAVKEETAAESMEAVPDPELVHRSYPRLSEHGEVDYILSSDKEWEKESGAAVIPSPASPLNPSASQSSFSTNPTIRTASDRCGESGSSSEAGPEGTEVKTEEEFEINEQNVVVKGNSLEEDVKEDTDMETTSDFKEEIKDGDEDPGVSSEQEIDAKQEDEPHGCNPMAATTDDLDEMMDIGTVDQVEQEAQMKEEEQQNSPADAGNRCSPGTSSEVTMEEEADVKPNISTPPPAEDEDVKLALDQIQSSSSPSSTTTTTTGRESSSPKAAMNGMNIFNPSLPRTDPETSHADPSSPSPPLVKVKDEPVDEEYDQALISSDFTASVKDEPNTAKEDLRIGCVFSVSPAAETQTLPTAQPSTSHMLCFNCKKSLIKGQTAFQRKGSTSLFCSTACLTTSLPGTTKICYNCQKVIIRPQDVILAPDAKGVMKEFCGQNCLTSFNYKKNCSSFRVHEFTKSSPPAVGPKSRCSMCTRFCISKHEVILSGAVHKFCSDACFNRFRSVNNLSMAGCGHCGSFCHSKPLMLKMEDGNKTLCNSECLAKYKEKTKVTQPCMMCQTTRLLAETIEHRNDDDSVNLFCSSSCLMAFKVKTVSASGSRLNCDSCEKISVPAYHLAMSDTSIRNFCRLQCVKAFQEKFKKSHKHMTVFTKLPIESTQIQPGTPPQPQQFFSNVPPNLDCAQCARNITFKPEVIQIKEKMVFLCSVDCSQDFQRVNYITRLCEFCKIEKITRDAKTIDNKDCHFCSDGCKLLFRHELSKNWGKHCSSCVYCNRVSKKLVTAQYGGSTEDFCSEDCRFKYTMLFCHVAKCDTCGCKGKLKQSLPLLGEVKHFCDLTCLLKFCSHKVATQGELLKGPGEATPIIANVISLADPPTGKPDDSDRAAAQQSTFSQTQSKKTGHMSVQTDAVKLPPPPPPAAAPKILKNKALLCRPLVQDKGVSCKAQTADVESQTDVAFPEVLIVPVPVPVFVPVPMNMYSQFTPRPVCLPLPLPVPVFLPVTMNSAERIIETIQAIKEKIPSDPFEAELILMAEMVAEQDENSKPERPKGKAVEKRTERQDAPDDHTSNFSDDLDTEELTSFLNNWEDASSDAGLRSPSRGYTQEKLNPMVDVPGGRPSEPSPEPPPPAPPPMDVEADFPVETLERMSRFREEGPPAPSPPPATTRRRPGQRKARDKRGRKSQRSKAAAAASQKGSSNKDLPLELPKLNSEYGLDAWRRWIQWRQTQPNIEKPRFGSRPIELKEDVLRCTTAELSYGLCCFIAEVKRPSGERYSPDSIFYLCLGIQQYLFENSRVENIFMDRFYNKFSTEFTTMLRAFKPPVTATGYIHSRVEEDYLWDCKQLGAYSPIVLLNTLLFFCCKYFGFTAVEQHRQLSFAHVMRCTKTNLDNTKTILLRFYPPISINEAEPDPEVPSKKRKEDEAKEEILEMVENTENPLRCPVRLYEFYLSKCSESVKQRTNLFYLLPERCCVPNSPLWFSSSALDDTTMEAMLTRILTVRELHLNKSKGGEAEKSAPKDPPFIPEEEEDMDSD
ncbi:zinc finger MYM-type protein 4 isoform X1 [Pleuronectes platessa]|uniref:zinc finger MYM-type protein 4 isoform X1 n=1 Tax=Pleuronectes platessa TaxID=8262 RepID=UPI00232A34D7|nr:zinc finger MYM-type protein 4 isoform X1 [Pleuronectes platessa]